MARVGRWIAGLVVAIAVFVPARPASAHGGTGSSDYRLELGEPSRPTAGATLRSVTFGERLELTRTTAAEVIVLGYEGEPYLRFDAQGVWQNLASPATYLNQDRYANASVPADAGATLAPRWTLISKGSTYAWHDHRAHWMSPEPPPITRADPEHPHVVYSDSIQLLIDGQLVQIPTTVVWIPTPNRLGWWAATIGWGGVAMALALLRRRRLFAIAALGTLAAVVTRAPGPPWLALALGSVAAALVGVTRRARVAAALAALGGVCVGAVRLDAFSRSLLSGSVPATAQRVALSMAIGLCGGALIGIAGTPRSRRDADSVAEPTADPGSTIGPG